MVEVRKRGRNFREKLKEKRFAEILEFKFLFPSLSFFLSSPRLIFFFFFPFRNENFVKVLVLDYCCFFSPFFPVVDSKEITSVVSYFTATVSMRIIISMIFIINGRV